MLSKEQILELLQPLQEPQLGVSLTELEWFRDIMVKENHVALTIVTLENRPEDTTALSDAARNLLSQHGLKDVHIRVRAASGMIVRA